MIWALKLLLIVVSAFANVSVGKETRQGILIRNTESRSLLWKEVVNGAKWDTAFITLKGEMINIVCFRKSQKFLFLFLIIFNSQSCNAVFYSEGTHRLGRHGCKCDQNYFF